MRVFVPALVMPDVEGRVQLAFLFAKCKMVGNLRLTFGCIGGASNGGRCALRSVEALLRRQRAENAFIFNQLRRINAAKESDC